MTLKEAWNYGKDLLSRATITEYETDAWLLLENVCACTRNDLYVRGEEPISGEQEMRYREFLERRVQRVPVQQILGKTYFCGLEFLVTPDVLCPRQDTESLVEEALKRIRPGDRLLDVCTGSGCIILSLLHFSKECKGTAVDLSEKALHVAKQNSEKLGIACDFVHSDLFDNIEGIYDVIVSNPPYIATKEIETLEPEVREFEPRMALDGMEDGLFFYRRILKEASGHLSADGWLLFEIGCDQGDAVRGLMQEAGYSEVQVVKDLAGLDRVVSGRLKEKSDV